MDRTLTATRFKAQCLALLDEVAETGESLVITKHGRPVARVAPVQATASLRGSVTFKVSEEELMAPLPEHWDAAER
jgi:prevent-host-death family protein